MVKRFWRSPSLLAETGVRTPLTIFLDGLVQRSTLVRSCLSVKGEANSNRNNLIFYALMVKRLRRRPLTAETGVRFSLGVPKQRSSHRTTSLFYPRLEINLVRTPFDGHL